MADPLSLAAYAVASLCFGDIHQTMYLDRHYYIDTKHTAWSKRSIRYALHEPEREFRYVSLDSQGELKQIYRVRVNITPEMAHEGKVPPMPVVLDGCCPPVG